MVGVVRKIKGNPNLNRGIGGTSRRYKHRYQSRDMRKVGRALAVCQRKPRLLKNDYALHGIVESCGVAMAEVPKKRWSLWLKFLKKVVAMAEIPKKGGRYG